MRSPFVHEWFTSNAAAGGDMIAIDAGPRTLTYAELDRRSNGLAHALTSVAPRGALVGILTDDIVTVVTSMIAILKAGCAFVPMDPSSGDARDRTDSPGNGGDLSPCCTYGGRGRLIITHLAKFGGVCGYGRRRQRGRESFPTFFSPVRRK